MFRGVIPALVTPMEENGTIDYDCLERLVDFHVQHQSDAILPCGTTGESPTLTHGEHQQIVKTVVSAAQDRIPVIAGTGSNNTREAVELTRAAQAMKVAGALVITPYYNKPTQEGLYEHFRTVATSVDIPIIVYNVPSRTGVNLLPETLARLARIPNIVAVKEASGSLEQVNRIQQLCDIIVLSGEDSLTYPMLALGARGVISVAANIVPHRIGEMIRLFHQGHHEEGLALHRKLYPLFIGLFVETNPIPVKAAMAMAGMIPPGIRLPLTPLTTKNRGNIEALLADLGPVCS
jgi:4-hydroxy-tetrahydrodipicolinate synthase